MREQMQRCLAFFSPTLPSRFLHPFHGHPGGIERRRFLSGSSQTSYIITSTFPANSPAFR